MPEQDSPKYTMGGTYKPSISDRVRALLPDRTLAETRAVVRAEADILHPVSIDDVSVWQGAIDFNVMRTKAQCVYIRAGYGNDGYDGTAGGNAAGAKAAGMPWGLSWFVKVGKDFKKHVASFQNAYQEYGGDLPRVWDVEYTEYASKDETTNWLTKLVKNWVEITKNDPPHPRTWPDRQGLNVPTPPPGDPVPDVASRLAWSYPFHFLRSAFPTDPTVPSYLKASQYFVRMRAIA